MQVLIAEDEHDTRELLAAFFRGKGCQVTTVTDGEDVVAQFQCKEPDLVLLDIRRPGTNGWAVLREVRRMASVPVIVVSSLSSAEDVVKGLGLGADDYLRKPFDLGELDARIQAVFRRRAPKRDGDQLRAGPVVIDDLAKVVRLSDRNVGLSPREYQLLKLLMGAPGRVFSHQEIIEQVWPPDSRADTSDVKQYVHLLRSKIESDPGRPALVQTVKGFGYKFSG